MKSIPAVRRPLTPMAQDFLSGLPAGMMTFTENNFPHIVEKFQRVWGRAQLMQNLKEELIFESRLNRSGFPPAVMGEIFDVFDYYEKHMTLPKKTCIWGDIEY
jgi:hypothetical protein